MKTAKIAINVFLFLLMIGTILGCGKKMAPKPLESSEVTYPQQYPKPEQ